MSETATVFVDRDGVINELLPDSLTGRPESPLRVADVSLMPGAAAALARLADAGWRLVGVSNQPAAAKGTASLDDLHAVQSHVLDLLGAEGVRFDGFELCLHHPEGVVSELTGPCDCRKPAPGMLLTAAARLGIELRRSWMVGDTDNDVLAGRAAGCRTVLIDNPRSNHKRAGASQADGVARDLPEAVDVILRAEALPSEQ